MGPWMYFSHSKNTLPLCVVGHSTQNVNWFFKNVQQIYLLQNYITLCMSFTFYLQVSCCPESICMAVQNLNLTLGIECFTYPWIVFYICVESVRKGEVLLQDVTLDISVRLNSWVSGWLQTNSPIRNSDFSISGTLCLFLQALWWTWTPLTPTQRLRPTPPPPQPARTCGETLTPYLQSEGRVPLFPSLLCLCKFIQRFLRHSVPHYGVPYLSLPSRVTPRPSYSII